MKIKSQVAFEANSYVCRSYGGKTGSGGLNSVEMHLRVKLRVQKGAITLE